MQDTIRWKGQNNYPGLTVGLIGELAAKWIEEVTKGRLKIDLVPAPDIIPVQESFQALSRGELDCLMTSYGAIYASIVPEAAILPGPPFAWDTPAEVYDAYYHRGIIEIVQGVHKKHNVYFIPQIIGGIRFLGASFLCYGIKDLEGKKIRAIGTASKYLENLGAHPINIQGTEIHHAMKVGEIEGTVSSMSVLPQLVDVLKCYIVSPNFGGDNGVYLFNLKSWKMLPDEIKHILEHTLKLRTLADSCYAELVRKKEMIEAADKYGVKFITWSSEDTAKAIEMALPFYDELAKASPEAAKIIKIIKQQMKDFGKIQ